MRLVGTNCLTHIQTKNNLSSTCPGQHVCGDGWRRRRNYPVPQMVDILHSLWVHEILQSPRRGFLEAKCRPCPFNLVSLLPIEIRVLSVHANPKPGSGSIKLFLLGTCEEPCVCRESSRYHSTFSNKAGINHHSRRAGYDQASEEVGYRLDVWINGTTHWGYTVGYLIVYLDHNLSYNSSLNLFQCWPLNPGSFSVDILYFKRIKSSENTSPW